MVFLSYPATDKVFLALKLPGLSGLGSRYELSSNLGRSNGCHDDRAEESHITIPNVLISHAALLSYGQLSRASPHGDELTYMWKRTPSRSL